MEVHYPRMVCRKIQSELEVAGKHANRDLMKRNTNIYAFLKPKPLLRYLKYLPNDAPLKLKPLLKYLKY